MKMKKTGALILILLGFAFLNIDAGSASEKDLQHNKTVTIKLSSMQCEMCVENITKAIKKVDGVVKVSVNLEKKKATVTYNSDKTNKNEIESAITSAGYDANDKSANTSAYEKLHSCCKRP